MVATGAMADHLSEYYPTSSIVLAPAQQKVVTLNCNENDHLMGRGGAYVIKASSVPGGNGSIAPFNNPILQQVPVWDADHDRISGIQFGLIGGPKAEHVIVWISCLSDNNDNGGN